MRIGVLKENGTQRAVVLLKTRAELVKYLMRKGLRWEIEFLSPLDKRTETICEELGKCDIYVWAKEK